MSLYDLTPPFASALLSLCVLEVRSFEVLAAADEAAYAGAVTGEVALALAAVALIEPGTEPEACARLNRPKKLEAPESRSCTGIGRAQKHTQGNQHEVVQMRCEQGSEHLCFRLCHSLFAVSRVALCCFDSLWILWRHR